MKKYKQLNRIFITQVAAFSVAILLISAFIFYRLSINHLEERVNSDYRAQMEILAREINHKVLMAVENVKALSSRTMIRRELYEYHIGNLPLDELLNYTRAKYIDGASVYGNMLLAERKDVTGIVIARFSREEVEFPENPKERYLSFIETGTGYDLLIRNEIVHNGIQIGTDTALFNFDSVFDGKGKYLKTVRLEESMLSGAGRPESTLSLPIGNTGCFLTSEFNREILREERGGITKTVLLLSILLIAAVLAVSYFTILRLTLQLLRERDEINSNLNESVREKEYLLKELHHRVKNNLTLITSFLNLQSTETDNQELIDRNRVLESRINAVSMVHYKLQSSDDSVDIEVGSYLEDLGNIIIRSNGAANVVLVAQKQREFMLPAKQVIPIGLITAELTINSIKHAIRNDGLRIRLGIAGRDDSLVLSYGDDGCPFPEDFDIEGSATMGFTIIRNLVRQLKGKLEQAGEEGKEIRIVIPL